MRLLLLPLLLHYLLLMKLGLHHCLLRNTPGMHLNVLLLLLPVIWIDLKFRKGPHNLRVSRIYNCRIGYRSLIRGSRLVCSSMSLLGINMGPGAGINRGGNSRDRRGHSDGCCNFRTHWHEWLQEWFLSNKRVLQSLLRSPSFEWVKTQHAREKVNKGPSILHFDIDFSI